MRRQNKLFSKPLELPKLGCFLGEIESGSPFLSIRLRQPHPARTLVKDGSASPITATISWLNQLAQSASPISQHNLSPFHLYIQLPITMKRPLITTKRPPIAKKLLNVLNTLLSPKMAYRDRDFPIETLNDHDKPLAGPKTAAPSSEPPMAMSLFGSQPQASSSPESRTRTIPWGSRSRRRRRR